MYGHLEQELKMETWRLMRHLHARASLPWICLGDFNEILSSDEKKNGGNMRPMSLMVEFRHTLLHCGLVDMGFKRNGRQGQLLLKKDWIVQLHQRSGARCSREQK